MPSATLRLSIAPRLIILLHALQLARACARRNGNSVRFKDKTRVNSGVNIKPSHSSASKAG